MWASLNSISAIVLITPAIFERYISFDGSTTGFFIMPEPVFFFLNDSLLCHCTANLVDVDTANLGSCLFLLALCRVEFWRKLPATFRTIFDLMKDGATVILRNAKIDMFKGSMRLAVDKWGRIEVTEPAQFVVKEDNNLSLVEYELVSVVEE
ncbi:Uncharacterized protein LOK49_LG09G00746 [Camellia lanceoleosa]|uniref:Uncharacterized protein n=1 Tax=Camellia lanceoleosa TaxID=1840588 RepID=A0ACC0GIJ2_9ERIC|nr:Uncharacterized protein LOK49_LG09G00746 [Camellia lanceoleosa]